MKLAYSTLACPSWSLEQSVEAALRYGFEGLEICLLDGEMLQPDLSPQKRKQALATCNGAGIPIICVDTSVCLAQPDPAVREEQIRQGMGFLELAADWDAPMIRVFGMPPKDCPLPLALSAAAQSLEPLAARACELGVSVALETHDAFYHSSDVLSVLAQVPGPGAGVLWDLVGPFSVGEPVAETLIQLSNRLLHVHIKDAVPSPVQEADWKLTFLGEGQVPVRDAMAALMSSGYNGWLSVEWEKKWQPDLAEPEIALPQYITMLQQYLSELN